MFARFAGIGVGHVIQYNPSKDTECEHGPGSCDDESDIVMNNTSGPILDSDAGDHGNQTRDEENDDDENNEDDDDEEDDDDDDEDDDDGAWDDEDGDGDDHITIENSDSEEYEDSEDEGPEYKF